MLGADPVGLRDQAGAQQLGEHPRVDSVGRHLGVADRLHILGVGEARINPARGEEVAQPVPALPTPDDRPVGAGERADVRHHRRAVTPQLCLSHGGAVGIERVNDERALVQIDSGEQHRDAPSTETGEMWHAASSFGTSSVAAAGATGIRLCAWRLGTSFRVPDAW